MTMEHRTDTAAHRQAIEHILTAINTAKDNPFILKDGTALMECYGLDRFSEAIDLDCQRASVPATCFFRTIDRACSQYGYTWREGKNTPTVQRAFVDYGNPATPLKIEVSHRKREVPEDKTVIIDGIRTYTISEMCKLKCAAYMSRDKIRDLFDISFIADRYYDDLTPDAKDMLAMALEYKDLDQFDYLIRTQPDPLIDPAGLEDRFLRTMDKAGLLGGQLRDATGQTGHDGVIPGDAGVMLPMPDPRPDMGTGNGAPPIAMA